MIAGEDLSFDQYKGKVVLVTNVACQCGLTSSNYKVGTASVNSMSVGDDCHDLVLRLSTRTCQQQHQLSTRRHTLHGSD